MVQQQHNDRLNNALFAIIVACLVLALIFVAVQLSIRNALPSSVSRESESPASSVNPVQPLHPQDSLTAGN